MKKIVFLVSSMGRGGAERVVSNLSDYYIKRGWQVDICMLLHNIIEYELNSKVNVVDLSYENSNKIIGKIKMLFTLRLYIKNSSASVFVPFLAKISVLFMLARLGIKLKNSRVVSSERIDPYTVKYSRMLRFLINRAFLLSDVIIFQTEKAKSFYNRKIQDKSVIIGNPIQINIKREQPEKDIISAGRLVPQKNHKSLVNAFARISKKFPEYQLHIYGEGVLRNELEEQIFSLKIQDKVFLKGVSIEYLSKLAKAEIFVLSSNYEGFSNALLEALLLGVPCISSDCAGSSEVIKDHENGLLYSVGNEFELETKLEELLLNKPLQLKLSKNAQRLSKDYGINNIIFKWINAFEK